MIGRRLLFSLELGHEVQPLCDTLPIGRIGFAEMPIWRSLIASGTSCMAAAILSDSDLPPITPARLGLYSRSP